MKNEKEIGKALRDKLSDLEQIPSDNVWNSIQKDLQKRKKERIVLIPFWIKTAGISSVALLFFILNNPHIRIDTFNIFKDFDNKKENKNESKNENNIKISNPYQDTNPYSQKQSNVLNIGSNSINKEENKETVDENSVVKRTPKFNPRTNLISVSTKLVHSKRNYSEKRINSKTIFADSNEKKVKYFNSNKRHKRNSNKYETLQTTSTVLLEQEKSKLDNATYCTSKFSKQHSEQVAETPKKDSLENTLERKKRTEVILYPKDKQDSTKVITNKFDLFAFIAPTVYGYLTNNSPIDSRLNANPATSQIKFSYGLYISYEITNNWSLRLGVEKTNLNYKTKDVVINTPNYQNVNYINKISNASIYSQSNNSSTMTFIQELEYTDIPLELKYKFVNNKIGIGIITGLTYISLTKNNLYVKLQNSQAIKVGKIQELSNKSFSINFGLGFDYKFSEKLKLNIEPIVKYHLVDYLNQSQNCKPYTFGVQTGLQYSFSFN
jgi:hypothetical protein